MHGGAFARRPDCYGVIAMAPLEITVISLPALLVAVSIGVTPAPLVTYAVFPFGVIAMSAG